MADVNNKNEIERTDTTTPANEDERPALADGYALTDVRDSLRTDDARMAFSADSELNSADTPFEGQDQSTTAVNWQESEDAAIIPVSEEASPTTLYPSASSSSSYSNGRANGVEVKNQVKEKAGQVIHKAGESLKSQLDTQKEKAADGLGSLTEAFHQTSDSLRESGQSQVGQYAESFASQMDRFTNYLREKDIDEIADEVTNYARKNPAVFLGGAFLVGVAISRFLKSSGSGAAAAALPSTSMSGQGYSSQGYRGSNVPDLSV